MSSGVLGFTPFLVSSSKAIFLGMPVSFFVLITWHLEIISTSSALVCLQAICCRSQPSHETTKTWPKPESVLPQRCSFEQTSKTKKLSPRQSWRKGALSGRNSPRLWELQPAAHLACSQIGLSKSHPKSTACPDARALSCLHTAGPMSVGVLCSPRAPGS